MKSVKVFLLTILVVTTALVGCGGGGGGGGGAGSISPTINTKLSESSAAQELVAQQFAGNFNNLSNYNINYNIRGNLIDKLRASTEKEIGVGQGLITYDQTNTITLFGCTYNYSGGQQMISLRDSAGKFTDDENLVDSIEIQSKNLICTISDASHVVNTTINGSIILSGFYTDNSFTIKTQNYVVAGTIDNIDSFSFSSNSNLSVNKTSFPYPTSGSYETGSFVFNENAYNYKTSYDGTNIATVDLTGAETLSMNINLATGIVSSPPTNTPVNTSLSQALIGSWELKKEKDDFGRMLEVRPNAEGKLDTITFTKNSLTTVSFDRTTNSSIDYFQTTENNKESITGTWSVSGNKLTAVSVEGTYTSTVSISGNELTHVTPDGGVDIYQKI